MLDVFGMFWDINSLEIHLSVPVLVHLFCHKTVLTSCIISLANNICSLNNPANFDSSVWLKVSQWSIFFGRFKYSLKTEFSKSDVFCRVPLVFLTLISGNCFCKKIIIFTFVSVTFHSRRMEKNCKRF